MRYLLFIVLLVAVVITAGCVGDNKKTVVNSTPTLTLTPEPIVTISNDVTPTYPTLAELVMTPSKNGQIQCGEYKCPPNWFCCNNLCYNPNEANTGFCCGNSVCPGTWWCDGNTCYNSTESENYEYCDFNFPGTIYNPISKTCDSGNYKNRNYYEYCALNYPGSHYNPSTNQCLYSNTTPSFVAKNVRIAATTDTYFGDPVTFFITCTKGDYFYLMIDGPSYKAKTLIAKKQLLTPSKSYSYVWNPKNSLIPGKYTIYAFDEWEESYDSVDVLV